MCVITLLNRASRGRYAQILHWPKYISIQLVSRQEKDHKNNFLEPKDWFQAFWSDLESDSELKFKAVWTRIGEGCCSHVNFKGITTFSLETKKLGSMKFCQCKWI